MRFPGKWTSYLGFLLLVMPLGAAAQERYMIGYAGFAGFQASMWAVKDLGLLNKYGLDGEVVMLPGSIRQIQALVSDSIHFGACRCRGFDPGNHGGRGCRAGRSIAEQVSF